MSEANLQNQLIEFQQLQQQLQGLANQKFQLTVEENETDKTLEELKTVDDKTVVYKSIGAVLLSVKDHKALAEELEEKKESVGVRIKALDRQEKALKERYQKLHEELTAAMGGPGNS